MFEFPPEMLALIVSQTDDTTTHILKSVNKQLRAASLEVLNTRLKEKKKHSQIRAQKLINFLYNENDEIPLQFCVSPSVLMQFDEIKSPRDRVRFMLNYTLTAGLLGVNVRTLNDIALVFYRASLRRSHSNPTPPFLPQFFPRFDAAIAQEITKYENLGTSWFFCEALTFFAYSSFILQELDFYFNLPFYDYDPQLNNKIYHIGFMLGIIICEYSRQFRPLDLQKSALTV